MHRKNNEAMQRVKEREREGGGRSVPSPLPPPLPLSTLIASSRSTDQTDRELKRSLALLRLALWPRRNTGTLERAAWLEPLARVSIETRFFSIYCPLLAGFFESIVRIYIYMCIRYAPRKWMFVGWWRLRVGKIFFSRKRNNPYFEIRCTLGDRPISYAVSKIFYIIPSYFRRTMCWVKLSFLFVIGKENNFRNCDLYSDQNFLKKKFFERHDRSFCILIDFRTMNYSTFHPSFSILSFYFSIFFKILISTPKFEN